MTQKYRPSAPALDPTAEPPSHRPPATAAGYDLHIVSARSAVRRVLAAQGRLLIGRGGDVVLEAPAVSREHAELSWSSEGLHIRDLSKHGTWVNDERLPRDRDYRIPWHSCICIGPYELSFSKVVQPAPGDKYSQSPLMQELMAELRMVAKSEIPILLLGETGVGKTHIAEYIHKHSLRPTAPFGSVNAAALPNNLLESELFGHVRNAFNDANDKAGLIEASNGGTFFFDEIGDMALESQAKLLAAIDQKLVRRVGDTRDRPVDVRFIFATNVPKTDLVRSKKIRPDLLQRMYPVYEIPPLRQRKEDILSLVKHFMIKYSRQSESNPNMTLSAALCEYLVGCPWPGNVRQLSRLIHLAIVLHPTAQVLEPRHIEKAMARSLPDEPLSLSEGQDSSVPPRSAPYLTAPPPLVKQLEALEAALIREAMRRADGNASKAASIFGPSRATFYRRAQELGISLTAERTT